MMHQQQADYQAGVDATEAQRIDLLREMYRLVGTSAKTVKPALLRSGEDSNSEIVGEIPLHTAVRILNMAVNEHMQARVQLSWEGQKVWTSLATRDGTTILEADPPSPCVNDRQLAVGSSSEVQPWLAQLRLDKYSAAFEEAGIEFIADLVDMDQTQIDDMVGAALMKVAEAKRASCKVVPYAVLVFLLLLR
jgi:hypothetical protein